MQYKLLKIQHGLESVAGTLVAATFKWKGGGKLKFDDAIITPELEYPTGVLGGNIEGAFIAETGSTLTLEDTDFSAETMVWLGNMGIKTVGGAASTFAFTFPTTTPNSISTFTWEVGTAAQEYEFGNGFCESFNIHGDVGADNGRIKVNAIMRGQKAAASTVTASLGFLTAYEPLNINNATLHLDTVGTAAGTASQTSLFLKAFSLDVKTGWMPGRYADGRSGKDFSVAEFGDYEISGKIRGVLTATAVTEIANARAGTPRIMALKLNGSSSRLVKLNLPMVFTDVPEIGDEKDGLIPVEFSFKSAYSRTTTAQAPEINVTTSASTTVS